MHHVFRTSCTLLLSLALAFLPLQSVALVQNMDMTQDAAGMQSEALGSHCADAAASDTQEDVVTACCCDHCEPACFTDCSQHTTSMSLPMEDLGEFDSQHPTLFGHIDFYSDRSSPPASPPPLA